MKRKFISLFLALMTVTVLLPTSFVKVRATTSGEISVGDYFQMGTYYDSPILWRCIGTDENGLLMLSDKIIAIKPFDAQTSQNDETGSHSRDDYRATTGSNYWADSNMRSWLNSCAPAGSVNWLCGNPPSAAYVDDGKNAYLSEAGFLDGFDGAEMDATKRVTQKSIVPAPEFMTGEYDGSESFGIDSGSMDDILLHYNAAYSEDVTDDMFLLDVRQLYLLYDNRSVLGEDFLQGIPTAEAVAHSEYTNSALTSSGKWKYWLRTPYADTNCEMYGVSFPDGIRSMRAFDSSVGVRPAFYLESGISLVGDGTSVNPYTLNNAAFAVTVADCEGGEVIACKMANAGNEIAVSVMPEDGYELTQLSVTGAHTNYTIENGVTKRSDNIYTFVMPEEAVTVTPQFDPIAYSGTKLIYDAEKGQIRIISDTSYDSVNLYIAQYKGNKKLVGFQVENISITAGETYTKNYVADTGLDTKIMLWSKVFSITDAKTAENEHAASLGGIEVNTAGTGTASKPILSLASVPDTADRHTLGAVDVSLSDGEVLDGVAEVRIKYNKNEGFNASNLLPGYFNPDTNEWEPINYMLDEENGEAVILTDHFSRFGLFEVERSGLPTAFAKPLTAAQLANMPSATASKLLGLMNVADPKIDEDTVGQALDALDKSYNNNYTNTAGAINTLVSKGGAIKTGTIGSIGTQFTIIGVAAACINVASTAYNKGVFTADTAIAVTKAGIGIGVGFASAPIQYAYMAASIGMMAYELYDEYQLKNAHKELQKYFTLYEYDQLKREAASIGISDWYGAVVIHWEDEWKREGFAKYWIAQFEKYYQKYYVGGVNANSSDTAARRFERFEHAIKNIISARAFAFSGDYASSSLLKKYPDMPAVTDWNKALAADICKNYEAHLMNLFKPLFKYYSRRAYDDALKLLERECEDLRTKLNQEITIHFYEDDDKEIAKNCYLLFEAANNKEWRQDFDKDGKATLTFSLLGYSQLGCPDSVTVFHKETDKPVGKITLPKEIDAGGTYSVAFQTGEFTQTIKIYEVLEKSTDDYMFAGLRGRICDLGDNADASKFTFTLDKKGCATVTLTSEEYTNAGSPEWLEIIGNEDEVVYQTKFSMGMTEIPLGGNAYGVKVKCKDTKSAEHFRGSAAKILYIADEDATPEVIAQTRLDDQGRARLMFDRSLYEFHNKNYRLYVYHTENGEELTETHDLSQSFQGSKKIATVTLSSTSPYSETLRIKEHTLTMSIGEKKQITVLSGTIYDLEISDPNVVASTVEGLIGALNPGTATITYTNQYGSSQTVTVSVTKPINNFVEGIYKVWLLYESQAFPELGYYPDPKEYEIGDVPRGYARVTCYVGPGADIVWIEHQGNLGNVYTFSGFDSNDPLAAGVNFGGHLLRLKDRKYNENDYLENSSIDGFNRVEIDATKQLILQWRYYYERTDLERLPD